MFRTVSFGHVLVLLKRNKEAEKKTTEWELIWLNHDSFTSASVSVLCFISAAGNTRPPHTQITSNHWKEVKRWRGDKCFRNFSGKERGSWAWCVCRLSVTVFDLFRASHWGQRKRNQSDKWFIISFINSVCFKGKWGLRREKVKDIHHMQQVQTQAADRRSRVRNRWLDCEDAALDHMTKGWRPG